MLEIVVDALHNSEESILVKEEYILLLIKRSAMIPLEVSCSPA